MWCCYIEKDFFVIWFIGEVCGEFYVFVVVEVGDVGVIVIVEFVGFFGDEFGFDFMMEVVFVIVY